MAGYTEVTDDDVWDHPHVRAVMPQILGAVTGPDGDLRRRVTSWVAGDACPALRGRVVDDLVDRLGSRSPGKRDGAAEALLAIGGPALPTLVNRLRKRPRGSVLTGLAGVIAGIGRTLDPQAGVPLQLDLGMALGFAPDLDSAWAVARALIRLRPGGPAPGEEDPAEVAALVLIGAKSLHRRRPRTGGAAGVGHGPGPEDSSPLPRAPADSRRRSEGPRRCPPDPAVCRVMGGADTDGS